jgi:hypothetical protein
MEEGFSEAQKERMDMRLSAEEWKVIRNLLKRGASHLIDEKPMLFIYRPDVLVSLASVLAKMSVHIDEEVDSIGDGEDSDMEVATAPTSGVATSLQQVSRCSWTSNVNCIQPWKSKSTPE